MHSLILDQSTVDKLRTIQVGTEVRDSEGKLVGFFHPAISPADVEQYECPVSEEELLRRAAVQDGRSLRSILDDLRKTS